MVAFAWCILGITLVVASLAARGARILTLRQHLIVTLVADAILIGSAVLVESTFGVIFWSVCFVLDYRAYRKHRDDDDDDNWRGRRWKRKLLSHLPKPVVTSPALQPI